MDNLKSTIGSEKASFIFEYVFMGRKEFDAGDMLLTVGAVKSYVTPLTDPPPTSIDLLFPAESVNAT